MIKKDTKEEPPLLIRGNGIPITGIMPIVIPILIK